MAAVIPLGLPIFYTWVIHHYFHEVFGENNLSLGIYSRDIYIPLVIGAIFCLYHMVGNGVDVKLRPSIVLFSTVLLLAVIWFLKNYFSLTLRFPHSFLVISLLTSCCALLMLAFFSLIKPSEILAYVNKRNTAAVYSLIALVSLLNYPMILKFLWQYASFLTAKSVCYLYKLFGIDLGLTLTPVSFNLHGGGFGIRIVMGCSGLEGIFFFIFAFSLLQLIGKKGIDVRVVAAYLVGAAFLFILNAVRISTFYFLGIQFEKMELGRAGKNWIESAFHNHLGWILYLLGIIIFVRIYRKIEAKGPCRVLARTC